MKIGMPTLIELKTFEDNLKLCQSLGLDFIEINMNLPQFNTSMDTHMIKELLNRYQIGVTLHAPERIDIGELDPIIRNGYFDVMIKTFEIAKEVGASLINLHLTEGIHFKLPDKKVYLNDTFIHDYMRHIQTFKDLVERYEVSVFIENTGIHHHGFIQKATDLLLESQWICLTYDIGHDVTSGYNDQSYYELHADQIYHYHIHDGHSTKNHLTLYSGELDINGFLKQVKNKKCSCVIEVKSVNHLTESIQLLRSKNIL